MRWLPQNIEVFFIMNHRTSSSYRVNERDSIYFHQFSANQTIEIWADIIKPVDEPEFAEECECKLAKIITTVPVNRQKLQLAIDEIAPGYKLMTWWIPETEDQF